MDNKENLIPEDDYEYEKALAEKVREEREKAKAEQAARAEKQKQLINLIIAVTCVNTSLSLILRIS